MSTQKVHLTAFAASLWTQQETAAPHSFAVSFPSEFLAHVIPALPHILMILMITRLHFGTKAQHTSLCLVQTQVTMGDLHTDRNTLIFNGVGGSSSNINVNSACAVPWTECGEDRQARHLRLRRRDRNNDTITDGLVDFIRRRRN